MTKISGSHPKNLKTIIINLTCRATEKCLYVHISMYVCTYMMSMNIYTHYCVNLKSIINLAVLADVLVQTVCGWRGSALTIYFHFILSCECYLFLLFNFI